MKMWKKEKKVVTLLIRHAEAVQQVLETAESSLLAFIEGNYDPKLNVETDRRETEADEIRREIQDILYAGAYLPHLREDIYQLAERIDDIADMAETCTDFFGTQQPAIPPEFNPAFRDLLQASLSSFRPLQQAIRAYFKPKGKLDDLRKYCTQVVKAESKVDKLEEDLTTRIFQSDLDLAHKMHLQQCILAITEASDRAEDAADHLDRVAVKSVV